MLAYGNLPVTVGACKAISTHTKCMIGASTNIPGSFQACPAPAHVWTRPVLTSRARDLPWVTRRDLECRGGDSEDEDDFDVDTHYWGLLQCELTPYGARFRKSRSCLVVVLRNINCFQEISRTISRIIIAKNAKYYVRFVLDFPRSQEGFSKQ